MTETGIVRRLDEFGRIVIPKEIRRTLCLREGDPLELFLDDGAVIFKKYSTLASLSKKGQMYLQALSKILTKWIVICDRDFPIASVGIPLASIRGYKGTELMYNIIHCTPFKPYIRNDTLKPPMRPLAGSEYFSTAVIPIVAGGECYGVIMLLTDNPDEVTNEVEIKLLQVAAEYLGSNIDGAIILG